MNFPGANRDPEVFDDPHEVILDGRRIVTWRSAPTSFGARVQPRSPVMRVTVEVWLERIPDFRLAADGEVTWAGGQSRGPRTVSVVF